MPTSIELPITLAYAKGAYSVAAELGSRRQRANLVLDSGSSTLAVLPQAYQPDDDAGLTPTKVAQQITYGAGVWAGPMLETTLGFGCGRNARTITDAQIALIETNAQVFYAADGIFGLAYDGLNTAHDCTDLLQQRGISPALTWPWTFQTDTAESLQAFKTELLEQPAVTLTPCFSALEVEGVLRNLFALQVGRALVHVAEADATLDQLAADPLNRGLLVLGGGEHCRHLFDGPMQTVRIVDDLYYNANLIGIQVGDGARIDAPPLQPEYISRSGSNAIIDTGSSFIVLQHELCRAVLAAFGALDPRLPELIAQFETAFGTQQGLPNAAIDPQDWPDLHFFLEGVNGAEVCLTCSPDHYWPRNALNAGQAFFLLLSQLPDWPDQSILGLPLLAGRYCVFDRRVRGNGVLRVAAARLPAE